MKKLVILVLVIIIWFSQVSALNTQEEDDYTCLFYTNGNQYLGFSDSERLSYVRGMMDVILEFYCVFFPEKYKIYKKEFKDITLKQLTRIFDKYLEENPEYWHYGASDTFMRALEEIFIGLN